MITILLRLHGLACLLTLLSLPLGASAMASQQDCDSESIISELGRSDPQGVMQILREAGNVKNSQAVLWRIERDGRPASHLFGTVHVPHPTVSQISDDTLDALRASRVVALEGGRVPREELPYVIAQANKLTTADDTPLQKFLSDDELKQVEKSISRAGYSPSLARRIRPWVAAMFLTGGDCADLRRRAPTQSLDEALVEEATRASIKVVGLETILEQYQSIASIDSKAQGMWLRSNLATHHRRNDIIATIAELYRFRRIDAVWKLTRALAHDVEISDQELAAVRDGLVTKRNERLFRRSLPLVEAGGAFVAVGAMHLLADDGLVERFRRHGFTVTQVE